MTDPELDETIQSTSNHVSRHLKDKTSPQISSTTDRPKGPKAEFLHELQNDDDEELIGFYQPKRWWFTSTAFPLVAGTFGPIGNLFSICSLVQTWRITIPPGGTEDKGERVRDPTWLLTLNSLALLCSILGNLIILGNFAHRIKYAIAQPLTIVLWYISAILLLIPLAFTSSLIIEPTSNHAFTQSYYYAMICVVIYTIIATLLALNVIGAYIFKAYPPSFNSLTIPQRTLMLQTISYVIYLALGALVFSTVEGWEFVDGVYWADYTLLTIGLGSDFPLTTNLGKGLLIPFAVGGIMMIGLVIGSIRGLVLERAKITVKKRQMMKERTKWKNKTDVPDGGKWSKHEFDAMRVIEDRANRTRRYTSLGTSLLAFLILWSMGALVFWFSEAPQSWTYFHSLYFTYTTLLTVGYGDLYPSSNSGKPFFVIWTLLAVPTVTVLISNLGDTVVRWLTQTTLWLAQRTILPERSRKNGPIKTLASFKDAIRKEQKREEQENEDGEANLQEDVEKLGGAVEEAEKQQGNSGGLSAKIAKEIKGLAVDVGLNPPKQYEWDQWKHWLELLGPDDGNHEDEAWWLSDEGPLFGSANSETLWVLDKLCEKLEKVLPDEIKEG
ncbi:hypothetical protein C8J56DRAFT_1006152 [Mycena floridula]|nr:hypothetical protein C8J56DRAFT_1006152 [Mycena floridula]